MLKKIIVLGLLAILMVALAGCGDENQWTMVESRNCYSIVKSDLYQDNYQISMAAYQEAVTHFFLRKTANTAMITGEHF